MADGEEREEKRLRMIRARGWDGKCGKIYLGLNHTIEGGTRDGEKERK